MAAPLQCYGDCKAVRAGCGGLSTDALEREHPLIRKYSASRLVAKRGRSQGVRRSRALEGAEAQSVRPDAGAASTVVAERDAGGLMTYLPGPDGARSRR